MASSSETVQTGLQDVTFESVADCSYHTHARYAAHAQTGGDAFSATPSLAWEMDSTILCRCRCMCLQFGHRTSPNPNAGNSIFSFPCAICSPQFIYQPHSAGSMCFLDGGLRITSLFFDLFLVCLLQSHVQSIKYICWRMLATASSRRCLQLGVMIMPQTPDCALAKHPPC